ncbi:MAG TPA: hypothetical protein VGM82_21305 [Gemmatimonadaceae bacterium]|jgi:hypothetical protein
MADRDWNKELAKIDKQLGAMSDDELVNFTAQIPAKAGGAAPTPAPAKGGKPGKVAAAPAPAREQTTKAWAVYARLVISVALGIGMVVWPYPSRCGLGLAAYLAAVTVVVGSGIWSAVWTWRHRASKAHTLSLLLVLWGLVLGSMEVLPRAGYAKADLNHPSNWSCPASP